MIKQLCDDLYDVFLSRTKSDDRILLNKVSEIFSYFFHNSLTLDSLESLIDLERKLVNSKGFNKNYIEKNIFQALSQGSLGCSPKKQLKNKYLILDEKLIKRTRSIEEKEKYTMSLKLANFSIEMFNFNKARDNFSSERKSLALGILSNLSNYYDIPEVLSLSLLALKSGKKPVIAAAIEFEKRYASTRNLSISFEAEQAWDKHFNAENSSSGW
ncbi:MAG: hypothetical protein GQ569_14980 [Methylococcaceae bacterium]|nr:hypothetical protein [Methylococcaceae bacterium]